MAIEQMQERLADLAADSFGERSLFGIGNVEVSVLVHQRRVLLLLVRDLGGSGARCQWTCAFP